MAIPSCYESSTTVSGMQDMRYELHATHWSTIISCGDDYYTYIYKSCYSMQYSSMTSQSRPLPHHRCPPVIQALRPRSASEIGFAWSDNRMLMRHIVATWQRMRQLISGMLVQNTQ